MTEAENGWLIGVNGVLAGKPGTEWEQVSDYRYSVNQILCEDDGSLVVGTAHGLWSVPADRNARWV